jgi:uncharacterized membrane protein
MRVVLGDALKIGVILSAAVIALGMLLFLAHYSGFSAGTFLTYNPQRVPHGSFNTGLSGIAIGIVHLDPFSIIELGLLILLATPVARVLLSIVLFYFEGDMKFVYITATVFAILLVSILVLPLLPFIGG